VDPSHPQSAFGSRVTSEVLFALARTTRPLSGREISRLLGRSEAGVRKALHTLAEHGLVQVQEASPALLYLLNRDHVAAPAFELLANLRHEFEQRIADEISGWPIQPVHASIFGSAARGDGDTASDIDIFIIRPNEIDEENADWRRQVERLADHIYRWSGNRASISEVSLRELARLRREQPPVVADLRSDAITLAGPATAELLKAGR
jgi:predicted nucleotidyltransferase/biotin operon repressor